MAYSLVNSSGYGTGLIRLPGQNVNAPSIPVPVRPDAVYQPTHVRTPATRSFVNGAETFGKPQILSGFWNPLPIASRTSDSGGPRSPASDLLHSLLGQAGVGARGAIDDAAVNAKSAADTAYGAMIRNLSRMGVNPQSPRFVGSMRKWAAGRAAMEAAARNQASRQGQQESFGRMFSIYRAMQDAEEAERNRQFQASQGREARGWQSNESLAGRLWQDQGAQRHRGWMTEDRDLSARASQAENDEYANLLDQYLQGQTAQTPVKPSFPLNTRGLNDTYERWGGTTSLLSPLTARERPRTVVPLSVSDPFR